MGRVMAYKNANRERIVHLLKRLPREDAAGQFRTANALAGIGIRARKGDAAVRGRLSSAARGWVGATHFMPVLAAFPTLPAPVCCEVAVALGDLAGGVAVSELARLSGDRDAGTRLIAVDALGKIGGPEAVAALKAAVEDINEGVRAEAVRALGQLAVAEKADVVERAEAETLFLDVIARDPSEYVREVADEALMAVRETVAQREIVAGRMAETAIPLAP